MEIFTLILYWTFFFKHLLFHPYRLAYAGALDCDFPTQRLCGEYWRKGKLPQDPYYFGDLAGTRPGTYYPVNIIFAWVGSFLNIDHAWILHTWNILLHSLATSIFAYYLFGQGLIGLFGALAWGYMGYHIKQNLMYVQAFTWITATLLFKSGICLGMLILSGTPPLVMYTIYGIVFLCPYILPLGLLIGLPQIIPYLRYHKKSVRHKATYEDKTMVGKLNLWSYIFTIFPIRIQDHLFGVGYEEFSFYLTPLVVFLALFGNPIIWVFVLTTVLLSFGGGVFKLFSKFMSRFPHRWGYFACLGLVWLSVDGLVKFNLPTQQLILLNILLGILLLHNRTLLPVYPFAQWIKKPSEHFETPLLKYLEGKGRVNNLPYPAYSGQINHIKSMGYCGGNHMKWLGDLRNLPKQGCGGYNWFDYKEDGEDLDKFGVKYHIGEKPIDPKWVKMEEFDNLYCNTNI